jgi:phosphoglycolate phosphatase
VNGAPAAFIFDLDGTLVASGRDIARAANVVRRHFDLAELPPAVLTGYVGDGVRKLLQRTLGHDAASGRTGLTVPEPILEEGQAVFARHYGAHLLDTTRLYPGVREVLAAFGAVPLHVATNKPRRFTDAILAGLGLDGVFRRIVAGDEAPERKPDPAHLAACLAGLEVAADRVVVVGDSPHDIAAARGLGAVAVGCAYGLVAPERVRAAAPDFVIEGFAQLLELFPALEAR